MTSFILFFGAFFAGIITGMGMGGGILLVPVLVFFAGQSQLAAQGLCLAAFLPTAALAAWFLHKKGRLDIPLAKKLIPWTLCGALPGALLAAWLPGELLQGVFGLFLLYLGLVEIRVFCQSAST